ncbi:MAG: CotH kinase family protein [Bacteroides sp.]|nr:CotH kinase family protein [Bacteroides sp.]MCM1378766.1 CotH kinase family protein [Bacteroides sp.]MCM1445383.1 CotH kinase family protein [Prevotella sp.]
MKKQLSILALSAISLCAVAQNPWLHIYRSDKGTKTTTNQIGYDQYGPIYETLTYGKFITMPYSEVDSITYQTLSSGSQYMNLHAGGDPEGERISLKNIKHWSIGVGVPTFRITTIGDPVYKEVPDKETYLDAILTIDGAGLYEDFSGDVKIRGRGNSTWNKDKKPYRLKLPEKTKLLGYRKAKNYVLLANRIDMSFMRNEVACLASQYSGADFPTHATPVNVYFNNIFKGSYMLIEKIGINNGSVNMPKDQEAITCMFQLDSGFDEEFKVKTETFNLPLMHKDPDLPEDPIAAKEWFNKWVADFAQMEKAVAAGTNVGNYLDYTSLAKYVFLYNLACNQEINHPKSTYMYKTEGGKWLFGPAWDFDWAFGYGPTYRAEAPGEVSREELDRMHDEAVALAKKLYGDGTDNWGFFTYNDVELLWTGYNVVCLSNGDNNWPYMSNAVNYEPSYKNFLLGTGKNNSTAINGDYQLGNGGEFFLSIIMDNKEFMAEYEKVWQEFQSHIDEFWADFEAYAKALEPSAANDATIWYINQAWTGSVDSEFDKVVDDSYVGAINQLRAWLEKRLEFIGDKSKNYGLYDPETTYKRGTLPFK